MFSLDPKIVTYPKIVPYQNLHFVIVQVSNNFFSILKKQSNSLAWKGVLDAREVIMKGLRWIVGIDKDINFWTYNWALDLQLGYALS